MNKYSCIYCSDCLNNHGFTVFNYFSPAESTLEIGFVETTYSVAENVSTVTVTVAILQGIVEDVVVVQFNTQNGTANGIILYVCLSHSFHF